MKTHTAFIIILPLVLATSGCSVVNNEPQAQAVDEVKLSDRVDIGISAVEISDYTIPAPTLGINGPGQYSWPSGGQITIAGRVKVKNYYFNKFYAPVNLEFTPDLVGNTAFFSQILMLDPGAEKYIQFSYTINLDSLTVTKERFDLEKQLRFTIYFTSGLAGSNASSERIDIDLDNNFYTLAMNIANAG